MTISFMALLKILALLVATPFVALVTLFPINDQPTSVGQMIVFVLVMALGVDILFLHYLHLSFNMSVGS